MHKVMSINRKLDKYLSNFEQESDLIHSTGERTGYWSNLSKKQNAKLMKLLGAHTTRECIKIAQPNVFDVIFSDKRAAGLELLRLTGSEAAVDLGCMWGALTIPLAKQVESVLGVDQTIESLLFSEARAKEEGLDNVKFLCGNLRNISLPEEAFDIAIVNGVLEWIPEQEPVVVDEFWYGTNKRYSTGNPGEMQKIFLKNVFAGLKVGGRLMLAIENRYDYKMIFGERDPHTGTMFTTLLPRWIANLISKISRRREYRPWIYSFNGLQALLKQVGFSSVTLYAVWPDYRSPEHICPYGFRDPNWRPIAARRENGKLGFKRVIANRLEWFLFGKCNLQCFAPSIIAIAKK